MIFSIVQLLVTLPIVDSLCVLNSIRATALYDSIQQDFNPYFVDDENTSKPSESADLDSIIQAKAQKYFLDLQPEQFLTFTLEEHKPLGCTAEESLVQAEDGAQHVFVSKVVSGGNADSAGLEVGDVITGITGSFDEIVEVIGAGLNRVRSLVTGKDADQYLIIKVIRGTNVIEDHETALVDLCILPEGDKDSNMVKCIETLYQSEYDVEDTTGPANCGDADTECMLDTMVGIWGDELGVEETSSENEEKPGEGKKKRPPPWSSRSSPSGTFVRDPKTGKLINLDDQ